MKFLYTALLVFLFIICANGQKTSDLTSVPNLEVIKSKWDVEVNNPLLNEDPFQAINDTRQAQQDEIEYRRQSQIRAKMGLPVEPKPIRVKPIETGSNKISITYIYEIKVKNTGAKKIDVITWNYLFFDLDTKQEIGRRQFMSKISIEPGKTKNVSMRSVSPPTGTINAKNADKKTRDKYLEQISIQTIQYADGSVWESESK